MSAQSPSNWVQAWSERGVCRLLNGHGCDRPKVSLESALDRWFRGHNALLRYLLSCSPEFNFIKLACKHPSLVLVTPLTPNSRRFRQGAAVHFKSVFRQYLHLRINA